jgi:integral membrane protein
MRPVLQSEVTGCGIASVGAIDRVTRITMFRTSIGRLRAVGIVEGVSFLVLLGIAMPLKYLAGMPQAVTVAGWLHGMLFIAFCIALTQARQEAMWDARRTGTVLIAALLPFGPFVIASGLRKQDEVIRAKR